MSNIDDKIHEEIERMPPWKKWLVFVMILVFSLFFLIFLLQFRPFQNWAVDQFTEYISRDFEGEIAIKEVDFSFSEGLRLKELVLVDQCDTVLYTKSMNLGLASSLTSLMDERLDLREIELENPRIHITKERGNGRSNFDIIMTKLLGRPTKDSDSETKIDVRQISFNDLELTFKDYNLNTNQEVYVKSGNIDIDVFSDNELEINSINIDKPRVSILHTVGDQFLIEKDIPRSEEDQSTIRKIKVHKMYVTDGSFEFFDQKNRHIQRNGQFNPSDVGMTDIYIKGHDILYDGQKELFVSIDEMSLKEKNGFVIRDFSCNDLHINDDNMSLPAFRLQTKHSLITRRLSLTYDKIEDLMDFDERVNIIGHFKNTKISSQDLRYFIPKLAEVPFFAGTQSDIYLDGLVQGKLNNLMTENVKIQIEDQLYLEADVHLRDITQLHREYLEIDVDTLATSIEFLEQLIPRFSPVENMYRLGEIQYKGGFKGYLNDFNLNGKLISEIGRGAVNLSLNTTTSIPKYSGKFDILDFDLGAWSGNKDLGKTTFNIDVKRGQGFNLEDLSVGIQGSIDRLVYKNYEHKNVTLDGVFANKGFIGKGAVVNEDSNVDYIGSVSFADRIPVYSFTSSIKKLNLKNLNLSPRFSSVEGVLEVDALGNSLDSLSGDIRVKGFHLVDTLGHEFALDSLYIRSEVDGDEQRLTLSSDIVKGKINGVYDIRTLPDVLKYGLENKYRSLMQKPLHGRSLKEHVFDYNFDISNTADFLQLAGLKEWKVNDAKISGSVDSRIDRYVLDANIESIIAKNLRLNSTNIDIIAGDRSTSFELSLDSVRYGGFSLDGTLLSGSVIDGDLVANLYAHDILEDGNYFHVGVEGAKSSEEYVLSLRSDSLSMFGSSWSFDPRNKIILGEGIHELKQVILHDDTRSIAAYSKDGKGLDLLVSGFDFKEIDRRYIADKYILLTGTGDVHIGVDDLYAASPRLAASVDIPHFYVTGGDYGSVSVRVDEKDNKEFDIYTLVAKGDSTVELRGKYSHLQQYVDAEFKSTTFPAKVFEPIIVSGIHGTKGGITSSGKIAGPLDDVKMDIKGKIFNGETTIDYTNVTYYFHDQPFICTDEVIDMTGSIVTDRDGEEAVITGGFTHKLFYKFRIGVELSGDNIIALDTKKGNDEVYYGFGKGAVDVGFTGPFYAVNMDLDCTPKKGSVINIPIQTTASDLDENFITYIDKRSLFTDSLQKEEKIRLSSLNVETNITMTPEAKVNLIFDESHGDIISGNGRGNIKMYISRYGDFEMYGDYTIVEGKYLFTAMNMIGKPFQVRSGSAIKWTGDPINASMDIVADYSVRAPLNIFLSEYLNQVNISEAQNKTDVDLQLLIGNTLYKPEINFDLSFPNVTGELRSYVNSKLHTLDDNQNELNNQVLGLIVFNNFLPSSTLQSIEGNDLQSVGISTLSEFVATQVSLLFTGILNESLSENGLISGVDFDIGLRKNSFLGVSNTNNSLLPDEIEVHLKNKFRFWDERLSLSLGGNYVRTPLVNIQEYVIGDFILEYFLTSDRKLKLRMYGRYDKDEVASTNNDRRIRYGLGLGYRTEFGSMLDLKNSISRDVKKSLREDR